jgi:hypothetical protein
MTVREKAIQAIQELPEDTNFTQIIRELSFLAGTEQAREEIRRGEGMNSTEAKNTLREWITK